MARVIIASVIMASVTIMVSVTYGKCNLWQVLLMASVTYGKSIMSSVIMAKILWQMKLSRSYKHISCSICEICAAWIV